MQRAERLQAREGGRTVRTLLEVDYLLGVSDATRLGALRFRVAADEPFLAVNPHGVPALLQLGRLVDATDRLVRDEETDEDLRMILAPGSSLGGARPKASVVDLDGGLCIAKFPKHDDDWSIERWERIALDLAARAGLRVADSRLVDVEGRRVLLSRRFDRSPEGRVPFLSALSMVDLRDGEQTSYPELADAITRYGAKARDDARELFRRLVFNVLCSNVDDHARNHGFLWSSEAGWVLSPAYDLNPVPVEIQPRILSTRINLDDATCDLELVLEVAEYFGLSNKDSRAIVREVASATEAWLDVARAHGATIAEIERLASAFEHDDLQRAQSL